MSVDYRVSVFSGTRVFRRYFIVGHACLREHSTNTKVIAIFVRRVMPLGNIAMEARTIVDTQYSVYATNDAANDAANDRSHRTGIVLADARAVISALWYALSVCSGRHGERHGADEYDVSNHLSSDFGVKGLQ
jgi:hypothetical protein